MNKKYLITTITISFAILFAFILALVLNKNTTNASSLEMQESTEVLSNDLFDESFEKVEFGGTKIRLLGESTPSAPSAPSAMGYQQIVDGEKVSIRVFAKVGKSDLANIDTANWSRFVCYYSGVKASQFGTEEIVNSPYAYKKLTGADKDYDEEDTYYIIYTLRNIPLLDPNPYCLNVKLSLTNVNGTTSTSIHSIIVNSVLGSQNEYDRVITLDNTGGSNGLDYVFRKFGDDTYYIPGGLNLYEYGQGRFTKPTKDGYTFSGYYTASTDGTRLINPDMTTQNGGFNSTMTVYAQWINGNAVFLKPNNDWVSNGARFAAYLFKDPNNNWYDMVKMDDYLYYLVITDDMADAYNKLIFCRMNGAKTENNWDEGTKWNQTSNLDICYGKTYNISGWDNSGYWSEL